MHRNKSDVALSRKVLYIGAAPEDHDSFRRILHEPSWRVTAAFSCQQAIACLCRDRIGVIVCDRHLPDGSWRDILSLIAELTEPSVVIVASEDGAATLRAEVQSLGGYEVLSKPFRPEEVSRVINAAWCERALLAGALLPA